MGGMRLLLCSVALACVTCSCSRAEAVRLGQAADTPPAKPATVLVELFTSEGCSSCPPADALLAELVERQPIDDVTIIGIGEHVDYWDRLGWRDPFSSPAFSMRQSDYEHTVFRTGSVYTPQIVIDGRLQAVGSDRPAVRRAIVQAARVDKAVVDVDPEASGRELRTRVSVDLPPKVQPDHAFEVVAGVVERGLITHVPRGENRGLTLRHSVVAHTLATIGRIAARERAFSQTITTSIDPAWKPADLQIIAFVQDRTTRQIVAVGSSRIQGVEHLP
jgi:hypothetical protein